MGHKNASKEIPGREVPGTNLVVTKGDPTQMRKMRCPGCQKMATATQDTKGQFVAVCMCGRTFTCRPM